MRRLGPAGELLGYQVQAILSGDGRRQVVLIVNQDGNTLTGHAVTLLDRLLEKA